MSTHPLEIEFIGHACYRIWENGKATVMTDPYTHSDLGMEDDGVTFEAETVIISSAIDLSHNNYKLAGPNAKVINALEVSVGKVEAVINGENVIAIPVTENPLHPTGPDDNGMYAFKAGGLWFCHIGDLGHALDEEALKPWLDKCDVLLAITGEVFSLTLEELDPMIDFLKPKYVFPMHYHIPPGGEKMLPISEFLNRRPEDPVLVVNDTKIALPLPEMKAGHPTIVVLRPAGWKLAKKQLKYSY